jgi:hypothetical protein
MTVVSSAIVGGFCLEALKAVGAVRVKEETNEWPEAAEIRHLPR